MDWTKESFVAKLWEPKQVSTDRRLVNVYTEVRRLQTKSPYTRTFSLHTNAVNALKETLLCYLMGLHLISSSGTSSCIQEYIQLSRMFKISEGCVPFTTPESLSGTFFFC
jgi:hypothetical protein